MSKKKTCDGARVIISLTDGPIYLLSETAATSKQNPVEYYRKAAQSMETAAARHLKEEPHFDRVDWEFDNLRDVCSYCGYDWEVDDDGTPCCCNEAVKEFESSKVTT